jgi:hypothetical protein
LTGVAGFSFPGFVFAIDGFSQYPGTGSFAHSTRSAKQKSMSQLIMADSVF